MCLRINGDQSALYPPVMLLHDILDACLQKVFDIPLSAHVYPEHTISLVVERERFCVLFSFLWEWSISSMSNSQSSDGAVSFTVSLHERCGFGDNRVSWGILWGHAVEYQGNRHKAILCPRNECCVCSWQKVKLSGWVTPLLSPVHPVMLADRVSGCDLAPGLGEKKSMCP